MLDGQDVTDRCWRFDTRTGKVGLYLVNEKGQKYLDETGRAPAMEMRRGRVQVFMRRRRQTRQEVSA